MFGSDLLVCTAANGSLPREASDLKPDWPRSVSEMGCRVLADWCGCINKCILRLSCLLIMSMTTTYVFFFLLACPSDKRDVFHLVLHLCALIGSMVTHITC